MSRRKRYTRNLGRALPQPLPSRATSTWLRFEHEVEPYGVFSYVKDAKERLDGVHRNEVDEICAWFAQHLDAPRLLERFDGCIGSTLAEAVRRALAALDVDDLDTAKMVLHSILAMRTP